MTTDTAQPADDPMRKAIGERDVQALCIAFFDKNPTQRQQDIIRSIAFKEHDNLIITALTRYGKTWSVAVGVALYLVFNDGKTVNEIAPKKKQTRKFRNVLLECIAECDALAVKDIHAASSSADRLKNEANKNRISLIDDNEVNFLTAGGKNDAEGLMGEGGDLIVLDESCDIPEAVYQKRVFRQLETEEGKEPPMLVEIGNPWHKMNHFYKHWEAQDHHSIQIGYEQALKEGRITQEKIDKARSELTPPQFRVLYEAQFPDQIEDALLKHSWMDDAKERQFEWYHDDEIKPDIFYGLDVAGMGEDRIVLTRIEYHNGQMQFTDVWHRGDSDDTSVTAQWARTHILETDGPDMSIDDEDERKESSDLDRVTVNVDYIGMGAGVWSELNKDGRFDVQKFKAGNSPTREKDRFRDRKAQYYFQLRDMFQDGDISLPEDVPAELIMELTHIKYELIGREKVKIEDPDSGSPDYADSLMMAAAVDSGISITSI